ncbi:MAG: hypothetical protein RR101_10285 [Burkholderiaceae bacterium]
MSFVRWVSIGALALCSAQAWASEDVYGVVDSRPAAKAGTWVVGGKDVVVTDQVRLDEKDGPAKVGACVKLDYESKAGARYLEKIETKKDARKCAKK